MSEPWKIVSYSSRCSFARVHNQFCTHPDYGSSGSYCLPDTCPLKPPAPQEVERLVDELIRITHFLGYTQCSLSLTERDIKLIQARSALLAAMVKPEEWKDKPLPIRKINDAICACIFEDNGHLQGFDEFDEMVRKILNEWRKVEVKP